jgi:hypothetical protein
MRLFQPASREASDGSISESPPLKPLNRPRRLVVGSFLLLVIGAWHVEAIGGQLTLNWVDTSAGELETSLERSPGIVGTFAVIATTAPGVTTYTDFAVSDATTYCYRVRAFNSVAFSQYSNAACRTTTPPPPLTLALGINQQAFALGDPLQVDVTVGNAGPAVMVDVYFGVLLPPSMGPILGCPAGDAVAYVVDMAAGPSEFVVTCLSSGPSSSVALYSNVSLAGELPPLVLTNFFSCDWPPIPAGDYTFFMSFTEAGTNNVVSQDTATITYFP